MKNPSDIFKVGIANTHPTPETKYKNDLIHPSIVYIPNGLGSTGSKWWMIATPYPSGDNQLENPILYKGNSNENIPPTTWIATKVIADTPPNNAYNSDPCLFFDGNRLWIFWRENGTDELKEMGNARGVFCTSTIDGVNCSSKRLISIDNNSDIDFNMSPCVFTNKNNKIVLYATHYELRPRRINRGLGIWDLNGDLSTGNFKLKTVSGIIGQESFDYWHGDYFVYNNTTYLVASNELGNIIRIARSIDGENFQFYGRPLISTSGSGYSYMYKPCARVIDGVFYLWHPARLNEINTIHTHSKKWDEFIVELENDVSFIK